MSIWATRYSADQDGFDSDKPGPIRYDGSHILPSRDSERGGCVDTAHIPGFITRDGYDNAGDGEDQPWWPYLRLAVRPAQRPGHDMWNRLHNFANKIDPTDPELAADIRAAADAEDTVILDVALVDTLIADLADWRAGVGDQS